MTTRRYENEDATDALELVDGESSEQITITVDGRDYSLEHVGDCLYSFGPADAPTPDEIGFDFGDSENPDEPIDHEMLVAEVGRIVLQAIRSKCAE